MSNPIKNIALYIKQQPKSVVQFLNVNYDSNLPYNSTIKEINQEVSKNITNNQFVSDLVTFIYTESHVNAIGQTIGAIGQAVGSIITGVSNSINQTKYRKSQESLQKTQLYSDLDYQRELLKLAENEAQSKFNLQLITYQEQARRAEEKAKLINQIIGSVVILSVFVGGAFLFKKLAKK